MANQSADSFLRSILPDIEYADAPQDYCDLEISILQDTDPQFQCLRMSMAPTENCPADMPPAVAAQLRCDEQCPERRQSPQELTPESSEPTVAPLAMRRAA